MMKCIKKIFQGEKSKNENKCNKIDNCLLVDFRKYKMDFFSGKNVFDVSWTEEERIFRFLDFYARHNSFYGSYEMEQDSYFVNNRRYLGRDRYNPKSTFGHKDDSLVAEEKRIKVLVDEVSDRIETDERYREEMYKRVVEKWKFEETRSSSGIRHDSGRKMISKGLTLQDLIDGRYDGFTVEEVHPIIINALKCLARSPDTPEEILEVILESKDKSVVASVAKNANLSLKIAERLYDIGYFHVYKTPERGYKLQRDDLEEDPWVLLSENPNTPPLVLERLVRHFGLCRGWFENLREHEIRGSLAVNPNTPFKYILEYAKSGCKYANNTVYNPNVTPEILRIFYNCDSPQTRKYVRSHPLCPPIELF